VTTEFQGWTRAVLSHVAAGVAADSTAGLGGLCFEFDASRWARSRSMDYHDLSPNPETGTVETIAVVG